MIIITLQQLKYVLSIADKGSLNEAAKSLFISQPSLSNSIKELENELKINIFIRTNRGMVLSKDGFEFIQYARQIVQQVELLEDKYTKNSYKKYHLSISTQHYGFVANAFIDFVKNFSKDEYDFTIRESRTFEIIEDVKNLRSELGIIYLSNYNKIVLQKIIKESNLCFIPLIKTKPHIFIGPNHPLASKKIVKLEDLEDYPYLSFEQGIHNSFYFSEEILSFRNVKKNIKVSDRAAIVNFMIGLNGYTISSGIYPSQLNGSNIVSIELDVDEVINIGILKHQDFELSNLAKQYIDQLKNNLSIY